MDRALAGDKWATGKLLTVLEHPTPEAGYVLSKLAPLAGTGHVIGVTGIPGAGKSTLISRLIGEYRERGYRVAVIAVDPTSPLSRGALLGDRLRMQRHSTDPGVFIRSLPTRGLKGGLSLAALTAIEALDALGYNKIFVETVGVGQTDVDIMYAAHTVLVVTMPGAGDDIQALKAGVMEIGDFYIVNKSDKPGAEKTFEYIKFALETGEVGSQRYGWKPRIILTSAVLGKGVREAVDAIEEHYRFLRERKALAEKLASRRKLLVRIMAERILSEQLERIYRGIEAPRLGEDIYVRAFSLARNACREIE